MERRCSLCGHTGRDVEVHQCYVGGLGYVPVVECRDRVACWERMDAQEQLAREKVA
jgi:hypothetical protein